MKLMKLTRRSLFGALFLAPFVRTLIPARPRAVVPVPPDLAALLARAEERQRWMTQVQAEMAAQREHMAALRAECDAILAKHQETRVHLNDINQVIKRGSVRILRSLPNA